MAGDGGAVVGAVDDEIMPLRLAQQGFVDGAGEMGVAVGGAQRRAQIGGVILTEAHIKRAGTGEADAVAAFAEIMRHRRDEAKPAAGFLHRDITGRTTGLVIIVDEREALFEIGTQLRERQITIGPIFLDLAHRHGLDDGQVHAAAMGEAHQLRHLYVVEILQRNRVELDLDTRRLRGIEPFHDAINIAPAGNVAKLLAVERIERHVDAAHAAIGKFVGEFCELRTVRRQRQLFQPAGLDVAAEVSDERHDILADQRFAAGQPQLAHAARDEDGTEPVEFFERQKILLGQKGHVLRHAIGTAEIAAVRYRDAQIGDGAAERVHHGGGFFRQGFRFSKRTGETIHVSVLTARCVGRRPELCSPNDVVTCLLSGKSVILAHIKSVRK
ncbi:hypothetical protein AT6N2_C0581 [Agrobacterium tumefaciens]|nr:hypothetical protein AT6N2_C0581 [Agrobacterium tumefaciens]